MPLGFVDPYSGAAGSTCSVSFDSIASNASVHDNQTEAEFHKAKFLGEWGVIKAKHGKGEIPSGTKVLSFDGPSVSGYVYAKNGKLILRQTQKGIGATKESEFDGAAQRTYLGSKTLKWSVPQQASRRDPEPVAAPTPRPPVGQNSTSTGSMTDEDVATMFVQVKDKLATEQGVNVKGSNPALDQKVYQAIGEQTGYTPAEVKGKIDAYKASGKKLSALKKKTMKRGNAPATVPDATPTNPAPVPKPHGVPTEPDKALVEATADSVGVDKADYSHEDVAAAYVMAKDKVVAESNGKWTLYSKNDEMDKLIYDLVQQKTGHNADEAKRAIAAYLSEPGKKLSTLKKSLIKQGKMKAEADTLKATDKPFKMPAVPAKAAPAKVTAPPVRRASAETPMEDHLNRITHGFSGADHDKALNALRNQASFAPSSMRTLLGLRRMSSSEARTFEQQHGRDALGGYLAREIVVHPSVLSEAGDRAFQKDLRAGWFSRCGQEHSGFDNFVAHECGHHIDAMMQRLNPAEVKSVWTIVGRELGIKPPLFFDQRSLAKWAAHHKDDLTEKVSGYAATSGEELLAEIWAEFTTHPSPRPHIKVIGEAMRALAERNAL